MAKKDNRQGRRIQISWFISGILSLLLTALITNQALAQVQQVQDEQQIKDTAISAFSTPQKVVVLPHTTSLLEKSASKAQAAPQKADINAALSLADIQFNRVYSPNCIACQTAVARLRQAITGEQDGSYRALGWNVRDVQWRQLIIQGQTASVTFSATLSSKLRFFDEFHQAHTVNPTEGLVYIYTLQKIDGNWLVINYVQDVAAGAALPVNNIKPSGQTGGPPPGVTLPKKIDTKVPKTPVPTK